MNALSKRRIFSRGLFLAISDAATKGAAVVVALLVARHYGPTVYGYFTLASALVALSLILTAFGFEREFVRRGSIDPIDLNLGLRLNLRAVALGGCTAYALLAVYLQIVANPAPVVQFALIMGPTLLLGQLHIPFRYYAMLVNRQSTAAWVQTLGALMVITATALLISTNRSVSDLLWAHLIINGAIVVLWWALVSEEHKRKPDRKAEFGEFVRRSLPFGLTNILWIIYFNAGSIMLAVLRTPEEVGVYAAGFRIVGVGYMVAFALISVFTPLLFATFAADTNTYRQYTRQLLSSLFLVGLLLALCLFTFSQFILSITVGESYVDGATSMEILACAAFLRFLNFGLCEILTTSGRQGARVYLESVLVVTNLAANAVLIPGLGATGAALACVAAESVLLVSAAATNLRVGIGNNRSGTSGPISNSID